MAQRLLMATPAKRALDFDEVASNGDTGIKKSGDIKNDVSETIKEIDVTPNDENKENSDTNRNQVSLTIHENVPLKTSDITYLNKESQQGNDLCDVIKESVADNPIIVDVKSDLATVQSVTSSTAQNDLATLDAADPVKHAEQPNKEEPKSKTASEPNSIKPEQKVVNGSHVSPKSGSPKSAKAVQSSITTTTTATYAATTSNKSFVSSASAKAVTSAVKTTSTR